MTNILVSANRQIIISGSYLSLIITAMLPLFFGNEWTKEYGYVILLAYSFIGVVTIAAYRDAKIFFIPSTVIFLYIIWSMAAGAWGYSTKAVQKTKDLLKFMEFQRVDEAFAIFMLTLAVLIPLSRLLSHKVLFPDGAAKFSSQQCYVLIFTLLPFLFLPINISVAGGQGNLDYIVISLIAISSITLLSQIRGSQRYVFYLLVLAITASFFATSKRYAIFLIFIIFFLEAYNGRLKFDFSLIIKFLFMLFTAITLILMMSIVRGYGYFNPDGFLDSFWYIDDYVMSKYFLMRFLNNIEANYFFFHAVNSIEMVLLDTDKITFGSTFFKVFFLPLPRELFPWKPDSMIHLYTTAYSPIVRARGGSYPINIVAELIWNFWFFASIGGVFLTWLVTKLDLALIRVSQQKQGLALIFYLFVFLNAIVFARGGGAGTFVFEILAALGFILIAKVLNFLLLSSRFSSRDVQVVKKEPWRDKKA